MFKVCMVTLVILILTSCTSEMEEGNENLFLVVYPEAYPVNDFDLGDGSSILLHEKINNLLITKVNETGDILWTKNHYINYLLNQYAISYIENNQIVLFYSNDDGVIKHVFDLQGEEILKDSFDNEKYRFTCKSDEFIFTAMIEHSDNTIKYSKYSIEGDFIETKSGGSYDPSILSVRDVVIRNGFIYMFGHHNFIGSDNPLQNPYYESFICQKYNMDWVLIDEYKVETEGRSIERSGQVTDENYIIMSLAEPQEKDTYFHLFNTETNTEKVFKYEGIKTASVYMSQLSQNEFAINGSREREINGSDPKISQLTILDSELNILNKTVYGSRDSGETIFLTKNHGEYYSVMGRSAGTDGDFASLGAIGLENMFYYRFYK